MTLLARIALLLLFPGCLVQAQVPGDDAFAPVRFLVGEWRGTASGRAGEGTVVRKYEFVLGGRFLHERNVSTYPVSEKKKTEEVHEHWSFISVDRRRKALVMRQFHGESFVNQFAFVPGMGAPARLVFESEGFENFSNEWKARETYEILGPDEFVEVFELAPPGKAFEVYSTNRFRRAVP